MNAVYLYDDKIVLTFNYKDEAKTVTMADLTDFLGSDISVSCWELDLISDSSYNQLFNLAKYPGSQRKASDHFSILQVPCLHETKRGVQLFGYRVLRLVG